MPRRPDDLALEHREVWFYWKERKAEKVLRERGITIANVASAYFDEHAVAEKDPGDDPSLGRYIGLTDPPAGQRRLLLVVHVEQEDAKELRVVTAWPAKTAEIRRYQEQFGRASPEPRPRRDRGSRASFMDEFYAHRPRRKSSSSRTTSPVAAYWSALRKSSPGARLRGVRLVRNYSQSELGRRSGIDPSVISRVEKGAEGLGVRRAKALAKALGVHPQHLLFGVPSRTDG